MSRLSRFVLRCVRLCTALACALSLAHPAAAQELIVSAAASLRDAFPVIAKGFERAQPGTKVVLNFGGSGALLQQIANGAPVDVFASADEKTMDKAAARGLIATATRVTFARNVLVLIVPSTGAAMPRSLGELTSDTYRHLALGNPAFVPAGHYAWQVLEAAALTRALQSKFVYANNVRQVLAYVGRRDVDAGFVYRTDALIDKGRVKIALPLETKTPVAYPIAQIASAAHSALAREFIDYVRRSAAQAVLAHYGFASP